MCRSGMADVFGDQALREPPLAPIPVARLQKVGRRFAGPTSSADVVALRDADLDVWGGEMLAVVGPSGSGKSTLLNILGLLDRPTEGSYMLLGQDTAVLDEASRTRFRAQTLGFVFQTFQLIDYRSALGNVALPLMHLGVPRGERARRSAEALDLVRMTARASARPQTMSGGERQRVAIARAIVHQPRLLLCDEPTGNLDSENGQAVMTLLRELVDPDRVVVVVTHDAGVADACDRRVSVVDGRVLGGV